MDNNKIKFVASVVTLPLSSVVASIIIVIAFWDINKPDMRSSLLLIAAFLFVSGLSAFLAYAFFRKLRVENARKDESLAERKSLIANQKKWIQTLETEISDLQFRISENEKQQKLQLDPVYIASNAEEPAFVLDAEGKIGYVNEGFEKLTGYTLNSILGSKPQDVLAGPETESRHLELITSGLDNQQPFSLEILNYRKSGTSFNASITIKPVKVNNEPVKYLAFLKDITAVKEEELKSKIFSQLVDNLKDAAFVTDNEGAIEWVNPGFEKITEYSSEEVIGRKPESFLRDKSYSRENMLAKGEAGDNSFPKEEIVYNYSKSGRGYWSSLSISPVYDEQGEVEKFIVIESDVTNQKVQEDKVREVENQIQKLREDQYTKSEELELREEELIEAMELCKKIKNEVQELWLMSDKLESAVIITDNDGKVEWVNEGFEKLFNCEFSQVAGKIPVFENITSSTACRQLQARH